MTDLYKIIPFNIHHGNCGGSLVQFQTSDSKVNALPFEIGKVLVMSDIKPDDVRGMHAHHETEEILVALTGGCTVEMDDGKGCNQTVFLSACGGRGTVKWRASQIQQSSQAALLLYPHVWRVMRDFEPDTMLMVIANMRYAENDYIRDRTEFEQVAQQWKGLGGTAERNK